jgi:hypothetical protein
MGNFLSTGMHVLKSAMWNKWSDFVNKVCGHSLLSYLSSILWNRVLLDKLIVAQLVKKLTAISGIEMFITVFTRAQHWQLSHVNPAHKFPSYFSKGYSNIILTSMIGSSKLPLPFTFYNQNAVCNSRSYACCIIHPSHPPWFDGPNNIWWSVEVMKLLILQYSPPSCLFLHLMSKYSPQHPVLKHPQLVPFP